MRTILLLMFSCLGLGIFSGNAQEVITWNFFAKKVANKTYEIHLTALIEEDWHIYSRATPGGGPLPTTVTFTKNPLVILQGETREKGARIQYHDKAFDVDVYAYAGTVDFVQVVKLKRNLSSEERSPATLKTKINGAVEFMACTNERCLVPEKKSFSVTIQ